MAKTPAKYELDDGASIFVEADVPEDYAESRVSIFGGHEAANRRNGARRSPGSRPLWKKSAARSHPWTCAPMK